MKKFFSTLLLALLVVILPYNNDAKAQDNTGTEFWFSLFAEGWIDDLPGLYVVGNYDATVTIDFIARNPANDPAGDPACTKYTFNLIGGIPQYVDIPYDLQVLCYRFYDNFANPETVQNNGIKVTSTAPIACYSQYFAAASSEMTPLLPVTEMGTEYHVTAYREITNTTNDFNARASVIAIEDNTVVTFTLPSYAWSSRDANGGMKRGPGSTWTATLNKGQSYTILCNDNGLGLNSTPTGSSISVTQNQGLTGLKITSTKPISVMGGTDCTWAGNDEYVGCGACDLTCTHLKPVDKWGSNYATTQTLVRPKQMSVLTTLRNPAPLNIEPYPANNNSRSVSDYLLITARDNATVVTITGVANYSKVLNAGEWFIYESPGTSNAASPPPLSPNGATHHKITSNNPIQVIQMMKGWQCDEDNPADPTQMLVIEEAKWDDNYIVANPTQYVNNFFAFIIYEPNANSDARSTLNLNAGGSNVPIPAGISPTGDGTGGWTAIGTTGYFFQRLTVNGGAAIKARSIPSGPGTPTYNFAFYASGSTNASSYGYMGGAVCQLEAYASSDEDTVCQGSPITLSLDSTQNGGLVAGLVNYTYSWNVYDASSTNVHSFTGVGGNPEYTYSPAVAGNMTAILEITDNAGCFTRDTVLFYVSPLPSITANAAVSACNSIVFPAITGTGLTGNQAYYTGTNGTGVQYLPGATTTTGGAFYMYDISYVNCSDEEAITITVNSSPVVDPASITTTCDGSNTVYTVSFTVTGGNGGPYTVTETPPGGIGGSFTGNVYTTNDINSGTAYSFEITDANPCPPATVSGVKNCLCTSDAGTMNSSAISVCGNGTISAPAGTVAPTLDANDVASFVLHTSSGGSLGTVLGTNTVSDFTFTGAPMVYGTTYYISRVVGDDDGTGNADLNDGCLSVSIGTPVTWSEAVTVSFTANSPICAGSSTSLDFTITGPSPFNIVYNNGSSNQNILNANANHSETITPTGTTTYTLVSVTSTTNNCSADFSGGAPSLTVDVHTTPTYTNLIESCNTSNTEYTVSFEVVNGQAPYNVAVNSPAGVTGTFAGNIWTSSPIPSGTAYSFSLSDGNPCGATSITGSNTCICLSDAGGMDQTELSLCGDGEIGASQDPGQPPYLDQNDVLGFVLHSNSGAALGTVHSQNATAAFSFDAATMTYGTTYYISSVVGNDDGTGAVDLTDNCLNVAFGTPVVWNELPTAIATSNAPICSGETLILTGNTTDPMTGVTYAWTGPNNYFSNDQNPVITNVTTAMNGSMTLVASKGSCQDVEVFNLNIYQSATADFNAELLNDVSEPHHYQFNNNSVNGSSYKWYFGDGDTSSIPDPDHLYMETIGESPVTLIAYGESGCNDTLTISVNLLVIPQNDTVLFYMPNSFTPDGNEYNQYFEPVFNESVDVTSYKMQIFNRWGEVIFESNDIEIGWDGSYESQLVPTGTYTWVVNFTDKYTFKTYRYEGHVLLLK
jgi:gliding motility-associated-like protein